MIEVLGLSAFSVVSAVLVVVVGGVTALAYLITKEEKFEDVVEAQRREQEELLQSLSSAQSAKSRKRNTKTKWKAKSSDDKTSSGADEVKEPPVDVVTTAAAVAHEPQATKAPQSTERSSRGAKTSSHPSSSSTSSKKPTDSDGEKANAAIKKNASKPSKVQVAVEEEVLFAAPNASLQVEAAPPSTLAENVPQPMPASKPSKSAVDEDIAKKSKQAAKPKKKARKDAFNLDAALEAIQVDHLGKSELQLITETLIAKQAGLEDWKSGGKGDTAEAQKRQLQQLIDDLDREKGNTQASVAKVRDLRQEMEQIKAQCKLDLAKAGARAAEEVKEMTNLRRRLDAQSKSHSAEIQELTAQRKQQSVDCSPADLKQLKEESLQYKKVTIMAQQLAEDKNSLLKECQQLQQNNKHLRGDVESQRAGTDAVHQMYKEKMVFCERELARYKNELEMRATQHTDSVDKRKTEESMIELGEDLRRLNTELEHHKNENAKLRHDLDKEISTKSDVEKHLETLSHDRAALVAKIHDLESHEQQRQSQLQALTIQKESLQGAVSKLESSTEPRSDDTLLEVKQGLEKANAACKEQTGELEKLKETHQEALDEMKRCKEVVDAGKQKNNELREKNWKAMDALETSEKAAAEKLKIFKRKLIKCMKTIHPEYKADGQAELGDLLDHFQNNCTSAAEQGLQKDQVDSITTENAALKASVQELELKVKESQVCLATARGELSSAISEKDQRETILQDTVNDLKRLEISVEAEAGKWQEKEAKLEDALRLASTNQKSDAEVVSLKMSLDEQVSANRDLNTKFEEVSRSGESLLKEKDSLQKELKSAKEQLASTAKALSEASDAQTQVQQTADKLKQQISQQGQGSVSISVKESDSEKDKLITSLKIENADLLEQLHDERDQIVVDVAPADDTEAVDGLKKQLETLTQQLSKEQESSASAEKSSQEMMQRLDNLSKANTQLSQVIQEHESAQSKEIEKAIEDAIGQVHAKLAEREKQLEDEKQTTTQLRLQVASLQQGMTTEGTSV